MEAHSLTLKHIQLIEASAGTGKTWTIAALYVRLILGHGTDDTRFTKPLRPRDILVVTFTEAATAELRERIRNRLAEAARFFRNDQHIKGDSFLDALRESYSDSKEWPGLAHRLSLAADDMDEAAIFT
ncbi:MAG: UvrD-helicase domain-containing protein, partial [Methylococcaceae bacterium]